MLFQADYSLIELNTLRLQSVVDHFVILSNVNELPQIKQFIDDKQVRFFILGGGSNLVLPEKYTGLAIYNQLKGINLVEENVDYVTVKVMAGEVWDDFVAYTLLHNWYGLENLSLIPGTVGASPIQNIGAYGVEAKDFIAYVEVYDIATNSFIQLSNAQCSFSYRNSIFKTQPNYIVTAVIFCLRKHAKLNTSYGDLAKALSLIVNPTAQDLRNIVMNIRSQKLPDPKFIANVGSFFHNPVMLNLDVEALCVKYNNLPVYPVDSTHSKVSAGWLIDNLGLKGYRQGNVGVYIKQALVLVNYATATKTEVLSLAKLIQDMVLKKYSIQLNIEPIIVI